jgi:hypothetical protein
MSSGLMPPKLLLRGLDSLYVSFFFDMGTGLLDWDDLAFRKERMKQTRNREYEEICLGGERLALMPHGKNPYAYILSNKSFEIRLSEHLRPGCHVQFFSEGLWTEGAEALLARIEDWRQKLGLRVSSPNRVSRADWAFDYHLGLVDFGLGDFVSRAVKNANWREHQTDQSFIFGTGEVVVRVYDKVTEIAQQSGKAWFHQLWGQSEDVWRIEFQVRGERLKQAGIRSTDDMMDLQADLLRELAHNHTTLRRKGSDSNRSRWPTHPLWVALQTDIAAMPQTGLVRQIDPQMPLDWRLYQQLKSMYGALKGAAAVDALRGGLSEVPTFDQFLARLPALLGPHHDETGWTHDIAHRINAHGLGQW